MSEKMATSCSHFYDLLSAFGSLVGGIT